jgi:hypothetical protein
MTDGYGEFYGLQIPRWLIFTLVIVGAYLLWLLLLNLPRMLYV